MKPKLYSYKVDINQKRTNYSPPNGEFGDWSESYSNSFESISKEDKYLDICSTVDLKPGKTGFLVWIEWSEGDSFGWASCARVESVGLFATRDLAEELEKALSSCKENQFSYKTKDGQVFKYGFAPWTGYFSRLESIYIEEVHIK